MIVSPSGVNAVTPMTIAPSPTSGTTIREIERHGTKAAKIRKPIPQASHEVRTVVSSSDVAPAPSASHDTVVRWLSTTMSDAIITTAKGAGEFIVLKTRNIIGAGIPITYIFPAYIQNRSQASGCTNWNTPYAPMSSTDPTMAFRITLRIAG